MRRFDEIYATACLHKGGEAVIEAALPSFSSSSELAARGDNEYLSAMSLRIFRAGLKHSMVDAKWPAFEHQFRQFEPLWCAHMSDEFIEQCMSNAALIRHLGKLKTIRTNALYILDVAEHHGSFGRYLAEWPVDNIVGLWLELKQKGAHLGGASASAFLRMVGKDTFKLTDDVVTLLKTEGVLAKSPSSQKELRAAQGAFNIWKKQSGRPLCEISRIVSMAVD